MFEMVPGLLSLITPCVVGAVYTVWGIKELRHQSKLHKHELQVIEYREECEKQERRRQQVAKNRPPCYTCAQLIIGCANGCQIKRNERDEATRFQCKFDGTGLAFDWPPECCGYYVPKKSNTGENDEG